MTEQRKIILLTDMVEAKLRKEEELKFYQEQLERLKQKMYFVQKEIDITNLCIKMVENESVVDFQERMLEKGSEDE